MLGFIIGRATQEPSADETILSWRGWASVFGYPRQVYSDNAQYFVAKKLEALFREKGTEILYRPVYSPWSMGKAEMAVLMVKEGLRKWA